MTGWGLHHAVGRTVCVLCKHNETVVLNGGMVVGADDVGPKPVVLCRCQKEGGSDGVLRVEDRQEQATY